MQRTLTTTSNGTVLLHRFTGAREPQAAGVTLALKHPGQDRGSRHPIAVAVAHADRLPDESKPTELSSTPACSLMWDAAVGAMACTFSHDGVAALRRHADGAGSVVLQLSQLPGADAEPLIDASQAEPSPLRLWFFPREQHSRVE